MTPQEALIVVEQARGLITLPGTQGDILREAVIELSKLVPRPELEQVKVEPKALNVVH